MEELTKTHIAQFRTAVLTAVIISGMTAQWVLGPYLFIGYPKVETVGFSFMYKVLVIALVCGAAGALFCKAALITDRLRKSFKSAFAQGGFVFACAMAFATCTWYFGPAALGSGKSIMEAYLFDPVIDPGVKEIGARIFGSLFSFSAGGAGGIFAPSLSSGAVIGGWIGKFFDPTREEHNLLILAGMTAFLTGVSRSPFTSAILVLEMTDRHSVIFQLMYAASFGYLIAMAIDRKSFYERMKMELLGRMTPVRKPHGDRRQQERFNPREEKDEDPPPGGFGLG